MTERDLFIAALQLDPAVRPDLLDRECAGDPALRQRIEILLAAHAEAQSAFGSAAGTVEYDSAASTQAADAASSVIAGRYKLLERIAEGGMGEVWVAEQFEPIKRKVALKLIKPGMDSKSVLGRFEAERQALAMMDHPNIAKVLDGGLAENGRPYFVMDYVKGIPITDYCDAARLGIAERLELFMQVCSAVQHAHQKGIIHRDLKPSNILVAPYDGKPVPKVIDFGLAKALHYSLTERTLHTAHESVLGTPLYMSPEQAQLNNLDVDTRSDIYSLGVLLYELLTGTTPLEKTRFQEAAWDEIRRIIREEEPPRPSTRLTTIDTLPSLAACRQTEPAKLTTQLRGELDWIVMKALEKDRGRRYETANGMARDIQRYLTDEPVDARPPSATYRLQKFVRRNKGRVIAAALVLLALVLGIAGTTAGMLSARQAERAAAEQRNIAEDARAAAETEKDQKERERKRADDERQRADAKASEALAEKKIAVQQETAAHAEKQRADTEAKKAVEEGEEAKRSAYKVGQLLSSLNLKAAELEVAKKRAEAQLLRSEGLLYANQIASAQREWDNGDAALAWQHLNASRKDFRGWEYNYLYTLFTSNQRTLRGHADVISGVAFSPDGKRIVSSSFDNTLKVWDAAGGNVIRTLKGHSDHILGMALSPDGTRIVSSSLDRTLRVWDLATGKEILTINLGSSSVSGVAFSPDGKRILAGGLLHHLTVWDALSGQKTLTFNGDSGSVTKVAFSPDGKQIVNGRWDGKIKVWDALSGQEIRTFDGHVQMVASLAFSPDGKRFVTGGLEGSVKVFNATSWRELFSLVGHTSTVTSVAFSPDGTLIASGGGALGVGGGDKTIKVWDATSSEEILTLLGHTEPVNCVAFSPDGKQIVSGSRDKTLKLWANNSQETLAQRRRRPPDRPLSLRDPNSKETLTLYGHFGIVGSVAFSPDGKRIGSGAWKLDNTVKLWNATTGTEELTLKGHSDSVNDLAFSPDGKRIVSSSDDGTLIEWDTADGRKLLTLKGHAGIVFGVAFSPDGKRIVSGGKDKTLRIWDSTNGREVLMLPGHAGTVGHVAYIPDGKRLVSGSSDKTLKVWDATSGQELLTFKGHTAGVRSVAFSPDGKRLVSGSSDKTLKVWDATSGQELLTLKGHTAPVTSVAFSPDGKRIVSGSYDHSLKVWDASSGQETLTIEGHAGGVYCVAFSPDGKRIVSGGQDGSLIAPLKIWDASRGPEAGE